MCYKKYLKDNKHSNLHLAQKYAWILNFFLRLYLFLEVHTSPRATLSQNSLLLAMYNVHGQISVHIFAQNGENGGYWSFIVVFIIFYVNG